MNNQGQIIQLLPLIPVIKCYFLQHAEKKGCSCQLVETGTVLYLKFDIKIKSLNNQGELKLLHDENDMLREQVVNLANQQTNGETTENSCTESSERLENLCKFYKPKQGW